jgi:carboxylesterase
MLKNQPFLLTGSNPDHACLLLHGLGGGAYEMQPLGEYLHRQGLTVQVLLYPGHDHPADKMPASTWQQWYAQILAAYEQLSKTYRQVSLVGFSTGCPLALHLAANRPVAKLALLSPYFLIRREWFYLMPVENYIYALDWLIKDVPRLRLPIFDPAMHRAAMETIFFRTFNIASVRSAMALIELVKPELSQVTNPALIVQSRKDTIVDPSGAEYLEQELGSTDKKLLWLDHSDHVVSLDREREQVFRAVGNFLVENS